MPTIENFLASINLSSDGVPIYVQLREQILRAVRLGVLTPGQQMPTMRQVAVALKIDLNTVRRAYEQLQAAGVLDLARGRGSFVAEAPPQTVSSDALEALARETHAAALAAGLDPRRLAERLHQLHENKE
jgi:GntR family transcriptional regulator